MKDFCFKNSQTALPFLKFFNGESMVNSVEKKCFDSFLVDYSKSQEKNIGWSAVAYAIEKLYDDKLVLFLIKTYGVGELEYASRIKSWQKNPNDIECKNILITCVRKDRLLLFKEILSSKPNIDVNQILEYTMRFAPTLPANPYPVEHRVKVSRILQIIIRESQNAFDYLELLFNKAANANFPEHYCTSANTNPFNSYCLCEAIKIGSLELVKYLLRKGALPNTVGSRSDQPSAFQLAVSTNRLDIAETLIQEMRNTDKLKYLYIAIKENDLEVAKLLLKYGTNPFEGGMASCPYATALLQNRTTFVDLFASEAGGKFFSKL